MGTAINGGHKFVNTLSGRSSKASPIILEKNDTTYSRNTLANQLNTSFSSLNSDMWLYMRKPV